MHSPCLCKLGSFFTCSGEVGVINALMLMYVKVWKRSLHHSRIFNRA